MSVPKASVWVAAMNRPSGEYAGDEEARAR